VGLFLQPWSLHGAWFGARKGIRHVIRPGVDFLEVVIQMELGGNDLRVFSFLVTTTRLSYVAVLNTKWFDILTPTYIGSAGI